MTKYVFICKDSASREQNKISLIIFYAEAKPMLYKDKTNEDEFLHPRCIVNLLYKKSRCMVNENFGSRSLVT